MKSVMISGIEVAVDDENRYLQLDDVLDIAPEMWQLISERYTGYEAMFCYHNTAAPEVFLRGAGAELTDDCIEIRLSRADYIKPAGYDTYVVRIDDANFSEVATMHDKRNPGAYWTSERVRSSIADWAVFAVLNGKEAAGYIMVQMRDHAQAEIYFAEAADAGQSTALLASAVEHAFLAGKAEVLFMAERSSTQHDTAISVGFRITGYYRGFKAIV